jgi:hypothetical protein
MEKLKSGMWFALAVLIGCGATLSASAQGTIETEFKVYGVCGMCEERIEKAYDQAGIVYAEWEQETNVLRLAYKAKKWTEEQLFQVAADVGHDTDAIKATDEVYANIHGCCRYRNEEAKCSEGADHDNGDED